MFLLNITRDNAKIFILVSIIAVLFLLGILIALFIRDSKLAKVNAVKSSTTNKDLVLESEDVLDSKDEEKNVEVTPLVSESKEPIEELEEVVSEVNTTEYEVLEEKEAIEPSVVESVVVETIDEVDTTTSKEEIKENVVISVEPSKEEVLANKEAEVVVSDNLDYSYNISINYRKSHQAKLILEPELQDIYKELKTYFLQYKKVKSRISFKKEKFSFGKEVLINMIVRGKKLYLYYNLDPKELDDKYHLVDVSDKTIGEKTPALLKVKSKRSVKYAKELFELFVTRYELVLEKPEKLVAVDYNEFLKERSFEQLLLEGLIVKTETKTKRKSSTPRKDDDIIEVVSVLQNTINSAQKVLDKIKEQTKEEINEVTAEQAEILVSDEVVKDEVKYEKSNTTGKMMIINIDTISNMFKENDEVTLKTLQQKKLLPLSCKRVKVLARGSIDKALTIKANEFSKQAMKMIIAKKGKVIII